MHKWAGFHPSGVTKSAFDAFGLTDENGNKVEVRKTHFGLRNGSVLFRLNGNRLPRSGYKFPKLSFQLSNKGDTVTATTSSEKYTLSAP